MGDPLGIGPEIIVRTLTAALSCGVPSGTRGSDNSKVVIFGHPKTFDHAANQLGNAKGWSKLIEAGAVKLIDVDPSFSVKQQALGPTAEGGRLSFAAVEAAIAAAKRPPSDPDYIDAIVTAPISKTSWKLAGHTEFPGHTELLAARFNAPDSGMLFVGPSLRVMLATIHVPLAKVTSELTAERVLRAIRLADRACRDFGIASPRIAVCGVNPHAGEGGLLGVEDERLIAPAVSQARSAGIDASGPHPADTIFGSARMGPGRTPRYDVVVAMYHDQGLVPIKLVDGYEAVNMTVGLPTVRTSPAHGTAFDIAGRGMADAASMRAAIGVATELVRARKR